MAAHPVAMVTPLNTITSRSTMTAMGHGITQPLDSYKLPNMQYCAWQPEF